MDVYKYFSVYDVRGKSRQSVKVGEAEKIDYLKDIINLSQDGK